MKYILNSNRVVFITYFLGIILFIGVSILSILAIGKCVSGIFEYKVIKGNPTLREFVNAIGNSSDYSIQNKTDEQLINDFREFMPQLSTKISLKNLSFDDLYDLKNKTYRTENGVIVLEEDLILKLGKNFKDKINCEEVNFSIIADKIMQERKYNEDRLSESWFNLFLLLFLIVVVFFLIYNFWKYSNYIRKHYKAINSIKTEIELLK